VQWESNGALQMPSAKRLSHFSDDGNFAFIEGSNTGIPVEELIAVDPITQLAVESALGASAAEAPVSEEADVAPDSDRLQLYSSILSTIDQANGITRLPGNSVDEYIKDKPFSLTRVDQLVNAYKVGLDHHLLNYQWRCELVFEIHRETAKSGCKGMFSATLRRIQLADSTAYDMITRHRVRIGEIPDPDAYDSRDDVEEEEEAEKGSSEEEQDENEKESTESSSANYRGAKSRKARPKAAVITLSGTIAEAVTAIQNYYHKANAKEAIKFCVLRVWGDLNVPLASRSDDASESMSPLRSKPRRTSLLLDSDSLEDAPAIRGVKSVVPEWPTHSPSSREAEGAAGAD
jgi:hypothetical protein